jgi:hypothetical protein
MADTPMTVVETARFLKDVRPIMSDSEREELVAFVAANPDAGEIIPETAASERFVGLWPAEGNVVAPGSSTTITANECHYSCWPLTERTRRQTSASSSATQ